MVLGPSSDVWDIEPNFCISVCIATSELLLWPDEGLLWTGLLLFPGSIYITVLTNFGPSCSWGNHERIKKTNL